MQKILTVEVIIYIANCIIEVQYVSPSALITKPILATKKKFIPVVAPETIIYMNIFKYDNSGTSTNNGYIPANKNKITKYIIPILS